jgi:hypothetical protein
MKIEYTKENPPNMNNTQIVTSLENTIFSFIPKTFVFNRVARTI